MENLLSETEAELIRKYLRFYRELATGKRKPTSSAQKHFIEVTLGHSTAETEHEIAYIKYVRLKNAEGEEEEDNNRGIRDPEIDGPTDEWFSREDWKKLRRRQRGDGRRG